MLARCLRRQSSNYVTSPTDRWYFAKCCLFEIVVFYNFFVKQRLVLKDKDDELVGCCCCWGNQTGSLFLATIMIGWHICSLCESLEKSTKAWRIKGLPFCKMIYVFCVKILIPSQQINFFKCNFFTQNKTSDVWGPLEWLIERFSSFWQCKKWKENRLKGWKCLLEVSCICTATNKSRCSSYHMVWMPAAEATLKNIKRKIWLLSGAASELECVMVLLTVTVVLSRPVPLHCSLVRPRR